MSEVNPTETINAALQQKIALFTRSHLPELEGGARLKTGKKELTTQEIKEKLPVDVEGKETTAPDYIKTQLPNLLTPAEAEALGIDPSEPFTNEQTERAARHLLQNLEVNPQRLQSIKDALPGLKAAYNLPEVIASLQVIGIEAVQQQYQKTYSSHRPTDATLGKGSRHRVYTLMGGFGDEVTLEGDSMKMVSKTEEGAPRFYKTATMDLQLAQSLFNAALPPERVIEVTKLQTQKDAATDPAEKAKLVHEKKLLRQKLYKAILTAYHVQPEKGDIAISPEEKDEIDQIATEVRTRMNTIEVNGRKLKNMDIMEANNLAFDGLLTSLGVSEEGRKLLEGDSLRMNIEANRQARMALPAEKRDIKIVADAVSEMLQDPVFASLDSQTKQLLQKIAEDRIRTDMSISGINNYFAQQGGLKPESITFSMFLPMGLKGTELLYRRTFSKEEPTPEIPDWLKPKIPILQLEQNNEQEGNTPRPVVTPQPGDPTREPPQRLTPADDAGEEGQEPITDDGRQPLPDKKAVRVYEGHSNKTHVLNEGSGGQEFAVPFKLRQGIHDTSLALRADTKNASRISIEDDATKPAGKEAFIIKQQGQELVLQHRGVEILLPPINMFSDQPFIIAINEETAVEIRGYDPDTRNIILRKVSGSKTLWENQQEQFSPPSTSQRETHSTIDEIVRKYTTDTATQPETSRATAITDEIAAEERRRTAAQNPRINMSEEALKSLARMPAAVAETTTPTDTGTTPGEEAVTSGEGATTTETSTVEETPPTAPSAATQTEQAPVVVQREESVELQTPTPPSTPIAPSPEEEREEIISTPRAEDAGLSGIEPAKIDEVRAEIEKIAEEATVIATPPTTTFTQPLRTDEALSLIDHSEALTERKVEAQDKFPVAPASVNETPLTQKIDTVEPAETFEASSITTAEAESQQDLADRLMAETFPVTERTRAIVEELQAFERNRYSSDREDRETISKRIDELRQKLSNALDLPIGGDMATLNQERRRAEEIGYDAISISKLVYPYGGLKPEQLDVVMSHAPADIRSAYDAYRAVENDHSEKYHAETRLEEAFDRAAGITPEEALKQHQIHHGSPHQDIGYRSVADAQSILLQDTWKQIRDARTVQSLFERRDAFIRGLAAEAGVSIYETNLGYKTQDLSLSPATPPSEQATTDESAYALIQNAINTIKSYDGSYRDDNLRSPEITEATLARSLPDASNITIERTRAGELGKGVIGKIFVGKTKGGIPGLRGETTTTEEIKIAIKTPTIDRSRIMDFWYAKEIVSTIEEAHVLEEIRQKQQELYPGSKSFVPDSVLIKNYRGAPALAMELVDNKNDLYSSERTLTPQQLRSAFAQYLKLQDVIHTAGFTCRDVKGGDIFYKEDEDRLIVLDWNVTHPMHSPQTKEDIERMNGDMAHAFTFFGENKTDAWTPEAREIMQSLEQRIYASQASQTPFDVKEAIRIIEGLPLGTEEPNAVVAEIPLPEKTTITEGEPAPIVPRTSPSTASEKPIPTPARSARLPRPEDLPEIESIQPGMDNLVGQMQENRAAIEELHASTQSRETARRMKDEVPPPPAPRERKKEQTSFFGGLRKRLNKQ